MAGRTTWLGWLMVLFGLGGLVAAAAWTELVRAGEAPDFAADYQPTLALMMMMSVMFFLPALVGGVGLVSERIWGAPVATIACILLLLAFPIGTPLGAFGLLTLRETKRVMPQPSPEARAAAAHFDEEYAAYQSEPRLTRTCEHLSPIEAAIRSAGIRMRPHLSASVEANAVLDLAALDAAHRRPRSVRYSEQPEDQRSPSAPLYGFLHCAACGSSIHFATAVSGPAVPRFPSTRHPVRFQR